MGRAAWLFLLAAPALTAAFACSAILGLEPPPPPADGGVDAGGSTGSGKLTCAALDAGLGPDATVAEGAYAPLVPVTSSDWDWFDATQINMGATQFLGGTFDGRYAYFAPSKGGLVLQHDTQAATFDQGWLAFDVAPAPLKAGGFSGAVYDGSRYVYFVPASTTGNVVARYDTQSGDPKGFASALSWDSFDLSTIGDAGPVAGFFGGAFDTRYLYLVPYLDGTPHGDVVRFDTKGRPPDAGHPDGGDAGSAGPFDNVANWSVSNVAASDPHAAGFNGAIYDGTTLFLVPFANDVFDAGVHGGKSSTVARLTLKNWPGGWSTYDLTNVNGLLYGFIGGGFDGHYVYLAPHASAVVARFESTSALASAAAWSTFDLTRVVAVTGTQVPLCSGTAFDGRFVYFLPGAPPLDILVRYDTLSTFTADCAWSSVDLGTVMVGGKAPGALGGAVFDGEYLYLIPASSGLFGRFHARTPASRPVLPAFQNGSFW
jgi:hypothetical protein